MSYCLSSVKILKYKVLLILKNKIMYSYREVDKLINRYFEIENNQVLQTREGILGSGDWICTAPNKKTAIITEVFINEWSSYHNVKMYNKIPKKYLKILNEN